MRFQYEKTSSPMRNIILSLIIFLSLTGLFYVGIASLSAHTEEKQEEYLTDAINNAITHCYAVEGSYPENLNYLKENYGVTYDSDKFFVAYQPMGSNLMPKVTIVSLEIE